MSLPNDFSKSVTTETTRIGSQVTVPAEVGSSVGGAELQTSSLLFSITTAMRATTRTTRVIVVTQDGSDGTSESSSTPTHALSNPEISLDIVRTTFVSDGRIMVGPTSHSGLGINPSVGSSSAETTSRYSSHTTASKPSVTPSSPSPNLSHSNSNSSTITAIIATITVIVPLVLVGALLFTLRCRSRRRNEDRNRQWFGHFAARRNQANESTIAFTDPETRRTTMTQPTTRHTSFATSFSHGLFTRLTVDQMPDIRQEPASTTSPRKSGIDSPVLPRFEDGRSLDDRHSELRTHDSISTSKDSESTR